MSKSGRNLKVFEVNFDGRFRHGVCTDTKVRALQLLGVTASHFARDGVVRDWEIEGDALLRASPHVPMRRKTSVRDGWCELANRPTGSAPANDVHVMDDGPGV
ncbi:hypothetical protein IQ289_31655 [Burkholderia sp. R-70006]|uniref:hypothetical protein n=1 Tax=Paraburkholderia domus TaxID=2793075 RepID=UPI00191326F4|nr:hypothetical protein [Paraburkholderia domus]MBK5052942.1 hypothetical protein [Burkholderia sp. R-70006]